MLVIIICLILKAKVSCQLLFSKQQPAKKIEKKKKKKDRPKAPFFQNSQQYGLPWLVLIA